MIDHPKIVVGDWIIVENTKCIVFCVYQSNSPNGACKVLLNKNKPTTRDADWNGQAWFFPDRPDFGGYVKSSNPLALKLKSGT